MKNIFLAIAATAAFCASAAAPAQRGPAMHRPTASPATLRYLATAGAADLYEIRASELAVQRAARPAVRAFGSMLVGDHTQSTRMVVAAARAAGINPAPPALDRNQQHMLSQLAALRGPAFEREYLRQQVTAHMQGLALHQGYARSGDVPGLRRTAGAIAPIVQRHLARARALAR